MEERKNTHFTPGPWRVGKPIGCAIFPIKAEGRRKAVVYASEEDSHLIAAAPEMYEWQEEVLEVLRRICLNTDDWIREQLEPVIYRGEQIGKKARGEK